MFEITNNHKEQFDMLSLFRIIDPNGVYDFTFENKYIVYHYEATHQLHYIALDIKTRYGSEILCRKLDNPVDPKEYRSMIPAILQAIKYTGDKRYLNPIRVNPMEVIDSIFRVILPEYGYAVREEQINLSKRMFEGLCGNTATVCEAEVGTGKTLAYLVASLVAKGIGNTGYSDGKPITVTTANIELQKSLVEKDIPQLSQMLMDYGMISRPMNTVLRKGKEHYFCKYRYKDYLEVISKHPEKYGNLIRAFEESEFEKKAFDLDAINLRPSLKDRICVKGSCAKCRFAGECKYQQYLRRARAMGNVDFQVTNHNLYLTSQKMKTDNGDENGILLSSDLIVVDEAHKLKETAEEVFGVRLNRSDIPKYVSAVKLLCKDGQSRTEYRSNLHTLLNLCEMLFSSLGKRATSEDSEDGRGTLIELSLSEQEGLRQMDDIIARVESARKRNRNGFDGNGKVIRDTLKEFRRTNNINVWIEEDENGEMTLCATPRDIASKLRSALWDKPCSHLLTSGTVSDGTDFSFFLKENGLDRIPNSRMAVSSTPSPFDYENHTRLFIPKGIPAPDNNDGDYIQAIAEHVVDLVRATNGHTAILFTSYKVLSAVYGLTKDRLSDYDVICMTRSNKTAIGNFKKSKNGVLFASGSMWEGVDCIGDCLSSVIIVRLPFPLRSAMMEKKKQEIGDVRAFIQDYAVPEMLIKLRQGIGRLIRSETDTGLITILDPRVRSKAYAARIENILGKYPEAESLEEVREFFLQVKPSTYFEV